MKLLDRVHDDAMRFVDRANHLRRTGDMKGAARSLRQAFLKERRAADMISKRRAAEPWRSVLHRSAAVLAIKCGQLREAERLIAVALAGDPPDDIADELRELLLDVYSAKSSRRNRQPFSKTVRNA